MADTLRNVVIEVEDEGPRRRVRLLVPQQDAPGVAEFSTAWPADLLLALAE